jgi:hypothetical protein
VDVGGEEGIGRVYRWAEWEVVGGTIRGLHDLFRFYEDGYKGWRRLY